MILNDEEVKERMESPINLMNRLKNVSKARQIPSMPEYKPPSSKDLIPDLDDKLADGTLRSKAAGIASAALSELSLRIPEIQKPEKLAQIAAEMNKILMTRQDRDDDDKRPQVIVYAPQVTHESHYESVVVNE
jgi:hypothetical protein